MTMTDLGELLVAAITVALVGWYKLPWLRAAFKQWFTVTIPDHSVKQSADPVADGMSLIAPIEDQRSAQYPIATPQNTRNEPVVIAPAINDLNELEQYMITRLALLVAAKELTQTAAIKIGLGIAPGSRSPRYQAARAALQAELTRLEAKPELIGEMADRIKREEMTPSA